MKETLKYYAKELKLPTLGNLEEPVREYRARQSLEELTAIGVKACLLGYRVLFYNATTLASELKEARDSYQLRRLEKTISRTDLLLLDELSYARFGQEESEFLFKVIAERSERTSTVITTSLKFSKWTEMFSNVTLVAALIDRLTYRSHILNMNGKSYRLQSQKKLA